MVKYFDSVFQKHKNFWTKKHLAPVLYGFVIFIASLLIQKYADVYVGAVKGAVVPDLILDHLPTVDIDFLIVQGALLLTAVILWLLLTKPKYFIFAIKTFSIYIITRSVFISLTHLGVSPRQLPLNPNSWGFGLYDWLYNTKGDFFFSGHTGAPYLMALIFWQEKFWRYFFLAISALFGASVLLAHIHYSIDVLAAPFIVYGIFIIARHIFYKDFAVSQAGN